MNFDDVSFEISDFVSPQMSPVICGVFVVLLVAGSLRAEEGYGSGRPAVGGGNFGGGYSEGVGGTGGGVGGNVGPSGGAGGYGGSSSGGGGYNNAGGGGGGAAAGGGYDGGELGEVQCAVY